MESLSAFTDSYLARQIRKSGNIVIKIRDNIIVSKNIVDVIKHVNYQLHRAYPPGVISENGQMTTKNKQCVSKIAR